MTKRNKKTKAGLQSAKAITDQEIANEMSANNNKKAQKSRPH
ncbi:hypothetical protein HNQ85_002254 [Anoxybacillus calidus]|jgi:hypothetical protein|uniref:Uncharacterized protein n=1 Tax=[Anoxybacillus] calidus TaxID=575178 RepID=A0A7V9Z0N9_9BACL|nr:hypothetical protein [Anoxybacillus calidus]MBA2871964.1 hypothetical protein [Anoxybacillus calidus]